MYATTLFSASNLRPVTLTRPVVALIRAFLGRPVVDQAPQQIDAVIDVEAAAPAEADQVGEPVEPQFFLRNPTDVARGLLGWAHSRCIVGILNEMTGLAWDDDQWSVHFGGALQEGRQGPIPLAVWQHVRAIETLLTGFEAGYFAERMADARAYDRARQCAEYGDVGDED